MGGIFYDIYDICVIYIYKIYDTLNDSEINQQIVGQVYDIYDVYICYIHDICAQMCSKLVQMCSNVYCIDVSAFIILLLGFLVKQKLISRY